MVRRRLVLLALVLSVPSVALLLRLFSIQILAEPSFDALRRSKDTRIEISLGERGRILARDGHTVLAEDHSVYSVLFQYYAPYGKPPLVALNPRERALTRLVQILQEDADASHTTFPEREVVEARLVEAGERWCEKHDPTRFDPKELSSFVPLIRHVPESTAARLRRGLKPYGSLEDGDALFHVSSDPESEGQGTYEVLFCVPLAMQMEITLGRIARLLDASSGEATEIYGKLKETVTRAAATMEAAAEQETRFGLAKRIAGSRAPREVYQELKETVQQALRGDDDGAVETSIATYEGRHADADAAWIRRKYADALWFRFSKERPLLLDDVPEKVVTAIEYHKDLFRGLEVSVSSRRAQPKEAFAQILGYVAPVPNEKVRALDQRAALERKATDPELGLDAVEAAELEELRSGELRDYRPLDALLHGPDAPVTEEEFLALRDGAIRAGESIGTKGLEKVHDRTLRAKHGVRRVSVDARGEAYDIRLSVPPKPGADIQTTIEAPLQEALYECLKQTILAGGGGGRGGSAVVMDVQTGAILAAVGAPSVDPVRWYSDGDYRAQVRTEWRGVPEEQKGEDYLFHRPFDLPLDPGSVFKLFVAVAALEAATPWEGDFTPTRQYLCEGRKFSLSPNVRKGCAHEQGHNKIDLVAAIGESCNHYFFYVGWKHLGASALWSWAQAYGFGEAPCGDVPVHAGYGRGVLARPEFAESGESEADLYAMDLAIGQRCVRATPLQVATAVAAIARADGLLPTPYLVVPGAPRKVVVRDPETGKPLQVGLRSPERTLGLVREGMWRAGHAEGGTVHNRSNLHDFDAAYKTGTAETGLKNSDGRKQYDGWLVGFAPFEEPRIAFAVVIERTTLYGGDACAPVVRRILDHFAESSPQDNVLAERSPKMEVSVRATDG